MSDNVVTLMALTDIVDQYLDGDERGWVAEFDWLDHNHGAQLWNLALDVQVNGIQDPIHVGHDGRVWDGHHRLRVASLLQIPIIPVIVEERSR